jgi:endoglucanase
MKQLLKITRLVFLILFVSFSINPESAFSQASPKRGMTLTPIITEGDIEVLASWGAKFARYQLFWLDNKADSGSANEYSKWLASELDRLETLLPVFEAYNISLVLDLHTPPGGFVTQKSPAWHRIFAEQWAQELLISSWKTIATRFKGKSIIWGYDLVNEPAEKRVNAGLLNWNLLVRKLAQEVRAIDPTRRLIVQPVYGDQSRLPRLELLPFENVVYSIHMYYPLRFQHQGLYGNPLGVLYPEGKFNKNALEKNLEKASKFQKKHNVDIYVGEFSAVRWAPKNSAFRYLRDVIKIFDKKKWSWTYHAFREDNAWSVEHGTNRKINQPTLQETNRLKLLKKYFKK